MSDARKQIFRAVSEALDRNRNLTGVLTRSEARSSYADTPPPRPAWDEPLRERFLSKLEAAAASWEALDAVTDLPGAVDAYLQRLELPRALRVAEHPLLNELTWPDGLTITTGTAHEGLDVGLSVADAAMGETGTLILCSGPESPTSLVFLPDHHLVVLSLERLVPYMEDVWPLLRRQPGFPPRSINYVTGPSRTADVEQTMQLGAHGPRSLHVLLIP